MKNVMQTYARFALAAFLLLVFIVALPVVSEAREPLDRHFLRNFFAQYTAILLPRPRYLEAGAILSSRYLDLEYSFFGCALPQLSAHPIKRYRPGVYFEAGSFTWGAKLDAAASGTASGNIEVDVTRSDKMLEERTLNVVVDEFVLARHDIRNYVDPKCLPLYDGSSEKIQTGEFFVAKAIYALDGDLRVDTSLKFDVSGSVHLSLKDIIGKRTGFDWLNDLVDSIDMNAEISAGANIVNLSTRSWRFPSPQPGEQYSYLAIIPSHIDTVVLKDVRKIYLKNKSYIQQSLEDQKSAQSFISYFPELDLRSDECLLRRLFRVGGEDVSEKVFDRDDAAMINTLYELNIVAGNLNRK